jgi:ubiquinone/menaquinone biosynthesis C-methylase UbiE
MNVDDLKALDNLWAKTHSYVVAQIMESYRRDSGQVLELGPFAGGIALELARLYPKLEITMADESPEVVSYLKQKALASGLAVVVKETDLGRLAFNDRQFDLVIFRGAVFFLGRKENLLQEIFRVLKPGGLAFVGGGHGKGVPQEVISQIAAELRKLHRKLGGRWLSVRELEEIVASSRLADRCQIVEEGGVWLNIRK